MAPQSVDTTIHPHPTGLAETLASDHAKPATSGLTLYGGWFCPFVQRVWILLTEKSIPYQYIEINPYKKEQHFLDLNPRGLVPTLSIAEPTQNGEDATGKINGKPVKEKVLFESSVILDYLDDIYHDDSFYPSNAYEKARMKLWMDHASSRIVPAFYRFLQHTPEKEYSLDSAREEFTKHVLTWIKEADPTGPFANGKQISMADVVVIPWAMRIFLIDHYKGGSGVPTKAESIPEGEDKEAWERWVKWFEAISGRESVQRTLSERQKYIDVYQRYAEDTTGSQVGQATRGGRGLP